MNYRIAQGKSGLPFHYPATNTVVVNDRLLLKFDSIPACSVWETPTKKHVPTAKVGSLSKSSFTENNLAQQSC